jgi:DNA-binding transcriptional LysR family regulator
MRAGHPFARAPTLEAYCAARHLVVSLTGNADGFVDRVVADAGTARRVALTAPNFLFALAVVADTDLLAAIPRRFAALHAPRFNVDVVESPIPFGRFNLNAVASKAALADEGVAWVFNALSA